MGKFQTGDRLEYLLFLHEQGEASLREEKELDDLLSSESDGPPEYSGWCQD